MNEQIEKLQAERFELESKIKRIKELQDVIDEKISKEYFGKFTHDDLEKLWNEGDTSKRFEILELNPNVEHHINKLDSHGGLRVGEIESEIIDDKFGESEWMEDTHELFDEFLKKGKRKGGRKLSKKKRNWEVIGIEHYSCPLCILSTWNRYEDKIGEAKEQIESHLRSWHKRSDLDEKIVTKNENNPNWNKEN